MVHFFWQGGSKAIEHVLDPIFSGVRPTMRCLVVTGGTGSQHREVAHITKCFSGSQAKAGKVSSSLQWLKLLRRLAAIDFLVEMNPWMGRTARKGLQGGLLAQGVFVA